MALRLRRSARFGAPGSHIRAWWNALQGQGVFGKINHRLKSSDFVTFLEYAGRFSVLVGVIFYVRECPARRSERDQKAWQVVYSSQRRDLYGRSEAMRALNEDHVSFQEIDLSGWQLAAAQLARADLRAANVTGANLRKANLREASLEHAALEGTSLDSACLSGANLAGSSLRGTTLVGAMATGASFWEATLNPDTSTGAPVRLDSAELSGATFGLAQLRQVHFTGANLTDVNFSGALVDVVDFEGSDLSGADFSFAEVRAVSLKNARNWQKIRSVQNAVFTDLRAAPVEFIAWAIARGALIGPRYTAFDAAELNEERGLERRRLARQGPPSTHSMWGWLRCRSPLRR
jgi:uncharacterized protein YjbI with pentapeptide repeats